MQDSTQTSLHNVYVLLGGTRQHALTKPDGSFRFVAKPGAYDIVFSYQDRTNILRQVALSPKDTVRLIIRLQSDRVTQSPVTAAPGTPPVSPENPAEGYVW